MKKFQQILSVILAVLLLVSLVPATDLTVFADKEDTAISAPVVEVAERAEDMSQPISMDEFAAAGTGDIFKITLTWRATPRDLDSHLEGENSAGTPFHIYYRNKNTYDTDGSPLASLDVDDTSGYGPENTTIFKSLPNKVYRFYVHNYSGEAQINGCGAIVRLYKNNTLIGTYTPPTNSGSGRYWNVFKIFNGNVYVVNKIDSTSTSNEKNINVNANNLNQNNIVITPKIANDSENDLSVTASNVQLKKGTSSELLDQVDGSFSLVDREFTASTVTLLKNNYRNYIIPSTVMQSWKRITINNLLDIDTSPVIFHTAFLKQDRRDGKPYVSTVFCQKSTATNDLANAYVEIQKESIDVFKGNKYNIVISAAGLGGKTCTYYIAQDGLHKISSTTGTFNAVDLHSKLDFQKQAYAYVVTSDGVTSELMPVNLTKKPETTSDKVVDFIKGGELSLLGSNTFSVKVPSSVPIFGDAEISLDAFKIPAGFEFNGQSLKISVGANIFNANQETKKDKPEEYEEWTKTVFKDWKESIDSIKDAFDKDKNKKAAKSFKEKWGIGDKYKKKEKNWNIDFMGYIEMELVDGKLVVKEGAISVEGSFSIEFTAQAAIWVIPVYYGVEAGASLGATGIVSRAIADSSLPFKFDVTLKLEPDLTVRAGVGFKDAGAGIYANATLPITFTIGEKHLVIKAKGEIGLEAKLFCFGGKVKLLDGTLNVLDKYFGSSRSVNDYASGSKTGAVTEYFVLPRDYLKDTSGWLSGTQIMDYQSASLSGLHLTHLQTAIYKDAAPKVVSFGDKMLMTWVADNAERDEYNRACLMYSVYNGSVWSAPQAVYDDGFNDQDPVIATDGEDVYFAWQKLCKTATEDDLNNVNGIVTAVEIYSAKYDGETGTICNVRRETSNSGYDYGQQIAILDGQAKLFYIRTNDTAALKNNTILESDLSGSSVAVIRSQNYIVDMAVAEDANGQKLVSYLVDTDGDTTTTTDIKLYTYETATGESVDETAKLLAEKPEATQISVKDIFYDTFCGKTTLFAVSSKEIYHINSDGVDSMYTPYSAISGDVNYVVINGLPMLYWTANTDCGNAVYSASFEDDVWTDPVAISDTDSFLSGVTIVNYKDSAKGVCTSTELTYNEETESYDVGQTDLCALDIGEKYDVSVDTLMIEEENIRIGQSMPFSVYVTNNGNTFVDKVQLLASDGMGYSRAPEVEVNLKPGEGKFVELWYKASENYGKTNLTVKLKQATPDANPDNNTVSKEIGLPKIVISDATIYRTGHSYVVSAFVTNESDVTANNVTILSKLDENVIHSNVVLTSMAPRGSSYIDFELLDSELPFEEGYVKVFLEVEGQDIIGSSSTVLIEQIAAECVHPLTNEVLQEATCIRNGRRTVTCLGCNAVLEDEILYAPGHNFGETDRCSACGIGKIIEDQMCTVTIPAGGEKSSFLFVPDSTASYCLFSEESKAFTVKIIDENSLAVYKTLASDGSVAFKAQYNFQSGRAYILEFENATDADISLPFTVAKYTAATTMYLSKEEISGHVGAEYQFGVAFLPMNTLPQQIQWSSSDPEIAEIDSNGKVYLKKIGVATITATTDNGVTDTCTVNVLDYPTIYAGEQKTVDITDVQKCEYFYFTPETDSVYFYYSVSDADTQGSILDADMHEIIADNDSGDGKNFSLQYPLKGGQTYILRSALASGEATGSFDVKVVNITERTNAAAAIGAMNPAAVIQGTVCPMCNETVTEWKALTGGVDVAEGEHAHYYVTGTLNSADAYVVKPGKDSTVCIVLVNADITSSGPFVYADKTGATVNIMGKGTVTTTGENTAYGANAGIYLGSSVTANLYGGTYIHTSTQDRFRYGAISLNHRDAVLNLYDGVTIGRAEQDQQTVSRNINADKGATVNMYGGVIRNGMSSNGGNVDLRDSSKLNMFGGSISNGYTTGQGGNIYANFYNGNTANCAINMYDGTITGGEAASYGGNISLAAAEINLFGGAVKDGVSGRNGGNIYLGTKGAVNKISGGTISGGQAVSGGNLCLMRGYTDITGGTIENGTATTNGGNIAIIDYDNEVTEVAVQNATIRDGAAENGSNICVTSADCLILENVEVVGDVYLTTGNSAVTLKGATNITGNVNFADADNTSKVIVDRSFSGSATLKVNEGMYIDGIFDTNRGEVNGDFAGMLKLDNGERLVHFNGQLIGLSTIEGKFEYCEACQKDVVWTKYDGSVQYVGIDAQRHFYLEEDTGYTYDSVNLMSVAAGGSVCFDLNGHTLTVNNARFWLTAEDAVLNILGTDGAINYTGCAIIQQNSGSVNIYGGTYTPTDTEHFAEYVTRQFVLQDATVNGNLTTQSVAAQIVLKGTTKVNKINLDAGGSLEVDPAWSGEAILDMDVTELENGQVPADTARCTGAGRIGKLTLTSGEQLINGDGALTIQAVEQDWTYRVENDQATIVGYTGNGGDVVIPTELGGYPVTAIGEKAFEGCTVLTSVTIPDSVADMANSVFNDCTNLVGIWVGENNAAFSNDAKGVLFDKQKTVLLQAPGAISGEYRIPDGVTTIKDTAFYSCANLTNVTIPDSVTEIGTKVFMRCRSLTSVVLPDSVTTIGDSAFYACNALASVKLSGGMTIVGRTIFANCDSLQEVHIPTSVTYIDKDAFYGCSALENVYYSGTQTQWEAIRLNTGNDKLLSAYFWFTYADFAITRQPADQHNKLGETATFAVEATGAVSYQWQRLKIGATAWSNISGATGASYSVKVSSSTVIPYRCVIKDAEGNELVTSAATIILPEPLVHITNTAGNQHVIKNSAVSFTVELDSEEGVTYQWQRCKSGNNWTNVSYTGNKTKTVTFDAASWAQYPFRCEITDANGTKIYTESYTYTLIEPPIAPNITSNPKDVYLISGNTATFSVEAVGSDLTYQWWRSKNGGATWGEYTGAGAQTSSISVKVYGGQEYLYMCEVKDGYGNTMKSKVVQPRLVSPVKITSQPKLTVSGGKATFSFTTAGDVKTYQWQRLKNGTWSDAVGTSYAGYNTATMSTTVKGTFRCRITSMTGTVTYTNEITFNG